MRGRFKLLILAISTLICSALAVTVLSSQPSGYANILSYFAHPVIFVNHKIKRFLQQRNWCISESDLARHNQDLREMIADLQAQNIALTAQNQYYLAHQEVIDFAQRYEFGNKLFAKIFFKNLSNQEHYALVDKGTTQGVQLGMVAVYKNCLIGKVITVYPEYCKIALLTDRNCKIAVYDEITGAVGICCGNNDVHQVVLSYVSHLQKINLDDRLISSGNGEIFPQGFGVGKVSDFTASGMYYLAYASLLVDLEAINSCYLISANKS